MGQTNGRVLIYYGCWQEQLNIPISTDLKLASCLNIHMTMANAIHCHSLQIKMKGGERRTPAKVWLYISWNFLIACFKPGIRKIDWHSVMFNPILKESFLKAFQWGVGRFVFPLRAGEWVVREIGYSKTKGLQHNEHIGVFGDKKQQSKRLTPP